LALKPEQIARLTQIVRDASTALAITTMGAKVPAAERERLVREGYIKLPIAGDLIFDSFAFGQVMQQHATAQGLSYAEFQNWLKKHPVALSRQEQYAVEVAQNRAGTYCVGLGNRYSEELGRILIDADQELAARTRGQIQNAVATKLAERQTVKQLKSALGNMTGDWKRDWDRIAVTESHQAHQEGYLHSVTEQYGDEEMLAKLPEPGACDQCLKHYLEDGRPIVRPASWWHAQGPNNAGRKQRDWKPVLGAMHPHCRCQLVRVPKGWGFNEAWDLMPLTKAMPAADLDVDYYAKLKDVEKSQQMFLGPRGGKWADARHTQSWRPEELAGPAARFFSKEDLATWQERYPADCGGPTGLCFPYAQLALRRFGDAATVVHARVLHEGRRIDHAWIEHNGRVYDYQNAELRNVSIPVKQFYAAVKPENIQRYTPEQALVMAARTGKHGPWEKPVRHLTVLQERAKNPVEWNLPAGARVSDPWKPKPVDPNTAWSHPDYGEGKGAAPWQQGTDWHPDFHKYDYMLVNSSGGKDSQAMLAHVVAQAKAAGFPLSKLVVVHADLGRVEWEGTRDLAKQQAEHYGLRFEVVQRRQNDLLEQIEERHGDLIQRETDVAKLREAGVGTWQMLADTAPDRILAVIGAAQGSSKWPGTHRATELQRKAQEVVAKPGKRKPEGTVDFGKTIAWPSADARYCTSDHKRAEVKKLMTKLSAEAGKPVRILNALGIRAQESASRAAMPNFSREETTGKRTVDRWYPIHLWPEERVWNEIKGSGVPTHKAYNLGMRRLSCAFCVFASKEDLMISAIHNPNLFQTYLDLEQKVGSSFKPQHSLAEIRAEIQAKQDAGYSLNELAEWVRKAYGFDFDLAKALVSPQPTLAVAVLEAAMARLGKHGVKPTTMTMEWKARGACVHLDTDTASHHVLYLPYPVAYNASLVVEAIAQKHGLLFEEHNPPGPLEGQDGDEMAKAQQLFLGPRGGKWADPQHTVSWHADIMQAPRAAKPEAAPAPPAEPEPKFPSHDNPIRQRLALRSMLDDSWRAADGIDDGAAKEYGTTLTKLASPATQERLQKEIAALSKYKGFDNARVLDADFKAWFGDWEAGEGSKVTKPDGSPAEQYGQPPTKVFHGTPAGGFKFFSKEKDKGYNIFGKGFYFTEDEEIATEYTKKDADDKVAFTTHYVDSQTGEEIPDLWPSAEAALLRKVGEQKNPNWDPAIVWAIVRAEDHSPEWQKPGHKWGAGRPVNVRKLIQEYWEPTGQDDPKIVQQVMDRVEKLQPAMLATVNWGGMFLQNYWKSKRQVSMSAQVQGAKRLHLLLGKEIKNAKRVYPKEEVFEVYLNIRKPIEMEQPVPKRELKSLSKLDADDDRKRLQESLDVVNVRLKAIPPGLGGMAARATVQADITSIERRLAEATDVGSVYVDDLIAHSDFSALDGKAGIKEYTVPITHEAFLALKQYLVKKTAGETYQGKQVLGLLHLTPPNVLTWGDVHYIMTNAHHYETGKKQFRQWAEKRGYDGIGHTGGWNIGKKAHKVWIAWEPNQIKDTTSTGFNPATDDITKAHKLDDRLVFQGFKVSVENAVGSVRKWHNRDNGTSGETVMKLPYGYIRGTRGADGEHVDVFVGHDEGAKNAYVVHTRTAPDFKQYDEDKVFLGLASAKAAKAAFLEHYNRPEFFGSMTTLPLEEFRTKVYAADGAMVKAWEAAVAAVGIPADRFHMVVKYARQGHPESRDALDAVYAALEKAAGYEGYGGGRDLSTTGTMGWWGNPARTAGETARHSRQAEPRQDWPLGRPDMKRKRPKHDPDKLPGRIVKVASVEGLRPPGAHHVHEFALVSNTTARKLDSDPKNKANLLRTAVGSRQLREAAKLAGSAVQYPPGKENVS
jgi:3'-phosphoadenosine 5'-phosphosulfate sulfotransferase (PAPS reductase)/FAD synthetase